LYSQRPKPFSHAIRTLDDFGENDKALGVEGSLRLPTSSPENDFSTVTFGSDKQYPISLSFVEYDRSFIDDDEATTVKFSLEFAETDAKSEPATITTALIAHKCFIARPLS
jgi:hypothetical protein